MTRGFFGWRKKGKIYGIYIPSDSYPEYAGKAVLNCLQGLSVKQMNDFIGHRIKLIKKCTSILKHRVQDVWWLLRTDWKSGSPLRSAEEKMLLIDASYFLADALFMEYGYVIDLDAIKPTLLVFRGYYTVPSRGWEHLRLPSKTSSEILYTRPVGRIDLTKPEHVNTLLLYGAFYNKYRPGLYRRYLKLTKMTDAQAIAVCSFPELYAADPKHEPSLNEAKRMLKEYLAHRLSTHN